MNTDMPMLELRDIHKSYNGKPALRALSLCLNRGEIFAYLGPNGAGKTTTLKILATLTFADSGEVRYQGRPVNRDCRDFLMQVGYIPDRPFMYDKLTGREFISFYLNIYKKPLDPATSERLRDIAGRFNILSRMDELVESYSHGMRQKLLFTAVFLQDPQLFLIDEPMVGLDPQGMVIIKELMRGEAEKGKTILMSTHSLEMAESVSDRIGIIHQGRLLRIMDRDRLEQEKNDARSDLTGIFLTLTSEQTSSAR